MKKFLAIFAAAAVVGTAGFAIVKTQKKSSESGAETTTAPTAQIQTEDSSYENGEEKTAETSEQESSSSESVNGQTEQPAENTLKSFNAQIDTVSGTMIIAAPEMSSEEAKSSDRISFSISGIDVTDSNGKTVKADDIMNFSKVQIFYSGEIMETYPAQISAQKIVLSSRQHCNVYFSVNDQIVKTLRVKTGSSVESADMPNAGAYCDVGTHFEGWTDGEKDVPYIKDIQDSVTLTAKIVED